MKGNEDHGREPPSLRLDLTPDQVPPLVAVRQWAARTLPFAEPDFVSDVQLVATELVTNAYDHAGGALRVRMAYEPLVRRLLVEVDDASIEPPVLRESCFRSTRGRGLQEALDLAEEAAYSIAAPDGRTAEEIIAADRKQTSDQYHRDMINEGVERTHEMGLDLLAERGLPLTLESGGGVRAALPPPTRTPTTLLQAVDRR